MADQEFLASYGVEIDESGVSRLNKILEENRALAESVAGAFDSAAESVRNFVSEVSNSLPYLYAGEGGGDVTENFLGDGVATLTIDLDLKQANKDLKAFIAEAKKPIPMTASASGILSAGKTALETLRSYYANNPLKIDVIPNIVYPNSNQDDGDSGNDTPTGNPGSGLPGLSSGGRFSSPTQVEVAEDGDAEYIIPIKKENRAIPLLRQLLSELSPSARESVMPQTSSGSADQAEQVNNSSPNIAGNAGEQIGQNNIQSSGTEKELISGFESQPVPNVIIPDLTSALSPGTITQNNQTVSAPLTINVRSSGANANDIGQSIYDTAERYLLRTMRSAFAV